MVVLSVAVSYAMMVRCHRVVRADNERLILCMMWILPSSVVKDTTTGK